MFRHVLVICLVLVATALDWYPKARVVYVDPEYYTAEMKCCKGEFKTRVKFNGRYGINSFIMSSHVRNYSSGLEGVYEAQINVTVTTFADTVGTGYFKGLVNSTTLVDVPINSQELGGAFIIEPDTVYFIQVWYGGDLTYPIFSDYDLSIAPIASMQTLVVMGVDYDA